MPTESIQQFLPIDETTIGHFITAPEFTLSCQLRVLFERLSISQTQFADRTMIDKGIVSRIVNERDRRGLNKDQTDKIVDFLKTDYCMDSQCLRNGTIIKMGWQELDLWHKSIQCRASLERTIRNMFGPDVSLLERSVMKAAEDMLPAILSTWDETNGRAPLSSPWVPDPSKYDYPALISQFQNLSHLQRLLVFLVVHDVNWETISSILGMTSSETLYIRRKLQNRIDLDGLPREVLIDVIAATSQREDRN